MRASNVSADVGLRRLASRARAALHPWQGARQQLGQVARRARLLPYEPERWTIDQWDVAYRTGRLDHFASLDELPRYALLAGYLTTFGHGKAILDVGCGQGLLRQLLGGVGFTHYTGIDLSAAAIDAARTLEDDRTTFIQGDVMTVELPTVDIVVLNEVLYYAAGPAAMLDTVDRALSVGGLVLTSMWRHPGDEALWSLLDRHYAAIDVTDVRNRANTLAKRGWRVACHRLTGAS